jgi:C1A family cysteine protease
MKFTLFAALAATAAAQVDLDDSSLDIRTRFDAFVDQFSKSYETEEARQYAFEAFAINDQKVQEYNSQDLTYTLGHNEYSDMKPEDFNDQMLGGYVEKDESEKNYDYSLADAATDAPDSIDWVTKGAVTPIKNQGQCGSCWAFSTVMGIEGDLFVEQGKLISLSEQDLVSCDHNGDQGCNGGLMDNAFKWVEENGICTEEAYPYTSGTGTTGTCKTTCTPAVKITGFTDVPQKDETALKAAVAKQPVSVAIEADKSVFQLYKSGVLTSKECGTQLDHGVGIVGYGTESGTDYWKVKNSWGTSWGMEGYILMERGTNECGISQSASYPTGATASGSAPSPSVSPSPSPAAPPAGQTHYGDPLDGSCMSDEVNITITGIQGSVCSPACTGILKTKCPTDVPAGVTAQPECALKDTSDDKYCALICSPDADITQEEDDSCGKATCKAISGTGLCTYDN